MANDKNEDKKTIENDDGYFKLALVGLGQCGGNVVYQTYMKTKNLSSRSEYKDLNAALNGISGINVWALNLGDEVKGLRRTDVKDGIDPNRAIKLGDEAGVNGAGGNPGKGRKLYEDPSNKLAINGVINQLLEEKANVIVVAFSTSGGTGSSFGPLFTEDLVKAFEKEDMPVLVIPLIVLPPDETSANIVTTIVSLGRMAQFISDFFGWEKKIEDFDVYKNQEIVPIILSNEQILTKMGWMGGSLGDEKSIGVRQIYRINDAIPADILTKLLFTCVGKNLDHFQEFLDPADIAKISKNRNPFTIPFFSDFSLDGSIETNFRRIVDNYIMQGDVDVPFVSKLTNKPDDDDYFKEMVDLAENTPITVSGLLAPMSREPTVEGVLTAIYSKNSKALAPANIKTWANVLGELGMNVIYPETSVTEPVSIDVFTNEMLTIDLNARIDQETGEPHYPSFKEDEAYILSLFGGASLAPLPIWIEKTKQLMKKLGEKKIYMKYGMRTAEIDECIDSIQKTWDLGTESQE